MKREETLALGDRKWVWKVREEERRDKQRDVEVERGREWQKKRERWKGCCHSPAASPDNPSSLHMINSGAANEPLPHIWNTNNRWKRLAACCYWTSPKINPDWITLKQPIWENAFRTEWETSTCQYFECWNHSLPKNLLLRSVPLFCTHFLSKKKCVTFCSHITYSVSGNMTIKRYSRDHEMYNETHTESSQFLWLKYLLFWFCVFFIMLGFSVGKKEEKIKKCSRETELLSEWRGGINQRIKSMRGRKTEREKENENSHLWQRLWLSNEAELQISWNTF